MSRNPYRANDKVNLLESVVVFLDILGVRKANGRDVPIEDQQARAIELRRVLSAALQEFRYGNNQLGKSEYRPYALKAFTDNIVVGVPLKGWNDEGMLGSAMADVAAFQLTMALSGYLVRGAIDVGPLYIDHDLVWGSGLITAYTAENTIAREPRVVLTEYARRRLCEHIAQGGYESLESTPQFLDIVVDVDEVPFLNYLMASIDDDNLEATVDTDIIERHQNLVSTGLSKHASDPAVLHKYVWLAHYHNRFCEEHRLHRDSIISSDKLVQSYRRLTLDDIERWLDVRDVAE